MIICLIDYITFVLLDIIENKLILKRLYKESKYFLLYTKALLLKNPKI